MRGIAQDLRYGVRMLFKAPAFTAAAVLTLALGIGANTAIFSVAQHAVLEAIAVASPGELAWMSSQSPGMDSPSQTQSFHLYSVLRDTDLPFRGFAAVAGRSTSLYAGNETQRVQIELVTGEFFPLLGVAPSLGRLLGPEDDQTPGAHAVAVLSYPFWADRFGSDPSVVGSTIRLTGRSYTVVGVAPDGFAGLSKGLPPELWVPMAMTSEIQPGWEPEDWRSSGWVWLSIFGRIDRGVDLGEARAAAEVAWTRHIEDRIARRDGQNVEWAESLRQTRFVLESAAYGNPRSRAHYAKMLTILGIVSGLLLLIACANVANLTLERGVARRQEIVVRLAIGAGRRRLARQLLTESLLLAIVGGAAGLALAWSGTNALGALLGIRQEVPVRLSTLAFAAVASGLAAALFGVAPAYAGSSLSLTAWLKGSAVLGGSNRRWGLRGAFVMAQVALCLPALIAAGLLLRSLENLYAVNTGFDAAQVVQGDIHTRGNGYSLERSRTLLDDLAARLALRPGIRSVAMGQAAAFSGWSSSRMLGREGEEEALGVSYGLVTPRYFETLGVPLLAGRDFSAGDSANAPQAGIVNKSLAERLFGGASPLGRGVGFQRDGPFDMTIVGVVADSKHDSLRTETPNMLYLPLAQHEFAQVTVYMRTDRGVNAAAALTQELKSVDPQLPVFRIQTLEDRIDDSLRSERSLTGLLTAFAALGLALAAVGLYGVMSYAVSKRTREIGLRKALGAQRGDLAALVLRGGLIWVVSGAAVGLGAAAGVTRLLERTLFGLEAIDPPTYAMGAGFLLLVALIAVLPPVFRATRVAPMEALRYE